MWLPPSPRGNNIGRASLVALGAVLLAGAASPAADPVESLIQAERDAYQEWLDAGEDPPAAFLPGAKAAVELFSPAYRDDAASLICSDPDLNELIELTGGTPTAFETVLNLSLPRVRDAVADACLVRPGDRVLAIGRGWQEEREIAGFVVRREKPACPSGDPHALWALLDRPLPEMPLFFTTDPAVLAGDNGFVPIEQYPVAPASADTTARLEKVVAFPEDYRVTAIDVRKEDLNALILFERVDVRGEDDGLPAMVVVALAPQGPRALWTERVDRRRGTGRFDVVGTLDFDGDGGTDIVVSGHHGGCAYTVVFRRSEDGFELVPLPVRSCAC